MAVAAGIGFPAVAAGQGAAGQGSTDRAPALAKTGPVKILSGPARRLHKTIAVQVRRLRADEAGQYGGALPGGVSRATLDAIGQCESGGDPGAVSADGTYRGKYQFDYGTWASVGGAGDPASAPESDQDYRAALLYAQSGPGAWPNSA
jgi:hypothetical protein